MRVRTGFRARSLAGAVLAVGLLTGCEPLDVTAGGEGSGTTAEAPAPVAGSARAALEGLAVKGRAPGTGYDRDRFGDGWVDTDRNGCDTRNDVLARDLTGEVFVPGTRDCVVRTGTLADPYSGTTIDFRRGQDTSDDVQVDHVVALSDAWQKGAQGWDEQRRVRFANDPLNLLAVDGALNMQKGDGDAATWLPPATGYRCAYVARQVAVKAGYGLWVTQAERDAIARVLSGCPDEPLPAARGTAGAGAAPRTEAYRDCSAVRARGAAPIRAGDPGWWGGGAGGGPRSLDGDGDGIGCE